MTIHVVSQGETLQSIADFYQISLELLQRINELPNPDNLVVGQTIVIRRPVELYTIAENDTLYSIAQDYETTPLELLQNNPSIAALDVLSVGTQLIIRFDDQLPTAPQRQGSLYVNGYAYPFIDREVLRKTLPYLTYLTIFTYGFLTNGELVTIDDAEVIQIAREYGVGPIMLVSTLTDEGTFSNELANVLLNDVGTQEALLRNIVNTMSEKGYIGLDIDFEYILPEDREAYVEFINRATNTLNSNGYFVSVSLAPKTSSTQQGLLYEAHDYNALGEAANFVLLMTYEWGYTYGPPMGVSPLNKVREVIEYGLTQIPSEKIFMGIPNYAYDWALPFQRGVSRAESLSNVQAVERAAWFRTEILFDDISQAPYYYYTTDEGVEHVVWFEDARSIEAKLALAPEYSLRGVSYWNIMRFFPQNWLVLSSLYDIVKEEPS